MCGIDAAHGPRLQPMMQILHHGQVNVAELRWFLSLCATQSTRASADQLGVSQSTLSRALCRIEDHVELELFDRVGRRLRLNHLGRLYRPHVQRAIGELDAGHQAVRLGQRALRLGLPHATASWLLGGPLRELTRRHPQISLSLREGTSRNLVAWLGQGLIDAAVISWFAADAVQRESTGAKWLAFPPPVLTLLMQPGHSLLKRGTVEVHALDHQPMVAYPRGTDVRTTVDSALAASAVVAETSFESSDTATLLAAVSAGLGSALIPMTGVAKNASPQFRRCRK